jgi:Tfp pilus assembly protein PilZ
LSQPNTGSSTKVQPIRARLEKFKTREEFARGYRQYITNDGILLPTRQVKDVGTRIALKLEIADGSVGLRADGEVTEHRRNSKGQTVAMFIRFDRIDPASQAVIQLALAEASGAAAKPEVEPSAEQSTPPVERPDLEAFAEELDSTFDAIFTSGAFSSVGDSSDSESDANQPPGLSLGSAPRLASAASDADDHR